MRDTSLSYYQNLWETAKILPNRNSAVIAAARRILDGKARYQSVEPKVDVPWQIIGSIALMENGCDWSKNLHNGESWARVTKLVPVGRGPFSSWEEAAIDALQSVRDTRPDLWDQQAGWSIAEGLKWLEQYNGMGYARREVNSPYLWSFTTAGEGVGKYIRDGVYSSTAVSSQVGVAAAWLALRDLGEMQGFGAYLSPLVNSIDDFEGPIWRYGAKGKAILKLQVLLASLGLYSGKLDADCGPLTAKGFRRLTGLCLSGDPEQMAGSVVELKLKMRKALVDYKKTAELFSESNQALERLAE